MYRDSTDRGSRVSLTTKARPWRLWLWGQRVHDRAHRHPCAIGGIEHGSQLCGPRPPGSETFGLRRREEVRGPVVERVERAAIAPCALAQLRSQRASGGVACVGPAMDDDVHHVIEGPSELGG